MTSVRTENEASPVARIAAAAREFIEKTYREEHIAHPYLEYPSVPDYADLEDELRPYIEREICQAVANARANSNFDFAALMRMWNHAEGEIARRELDATRTLDGRKMPPLLPPGDEPGPGEGQ